MLKKCKPWPLFFFLITAQAQATEMVSLSKDERDESQKTTSSVANHKNNFLGAQSLSLEIGGTYVRFGGPAYPKIALQGEPKNFFYTHGEGTSFRLFWDFMAMNLDWRIGVNGAFPSYMGFQATAGINKDLAPWPNPRIIARGAAGLEIMGAGGQLGSSFLIPVAVGNGEIALEYALAPQFAIGGSFALGLRYGLPLGFGLDAGAHLRGSYRF